MSQSRQAQSAKSQQPPPKPRAGGSRGNRHAPREAFSQLRRRGRLQREDTASGPQDEVEVGSIAGASTESPTVIDSSAAILPRESQPRDAILVEPLKAATAAQIGARREAERARPSFHTPVAANRVVESALASEENRRAYEQLASHVLGDIVGFPTACVGFLAADAAGDSTLVVASLARVLATRLGKVTIIDGDSEQKCLSLLYGLAERKGLSDAAYGVEPVLRSVIPTSDGVNVIPTGTPFDDIEPVRREAWGQILASVRSQSRVALIDLGALQSVSSQHLARLCESVYLVAALGRTRRRRYEDLVDQIPRQGIRLRGTIAAW